MSSEVIKVNKLSKIYKIGKVGTGTLSHDIKRFFYKKLNYSDPYSIVDQSIQSSKTNKNKIALNDISFGVKKGEVLGIIGKNGAGKSTLLKILSRITSPSSGSIKAKGRIASLLEVGTGMHPELSARENIYLNGTILGMNKKEIKLNFDNIIDFSGCNSYVDTPIKRFSTGMRVRLGFSVAAFLNPEILIVDEVLAVGDAEFQKNALGKIKDVSLNQGKTVLFVSHNMHAISSMCSRCILLNNGKLSYDGSVQKAISSYFEMSFKASINTDLSIRLDRFGNNKFIFSNVFLIGNNGKIVDHYKPGQKIKIKLVLKSNINTSKSLVVYPSIVIYNSHGVRILSLASGLNNNKLKISKDNSVIFLELDKNQLSPGIYSCNLHLDEDPKSTIIVDKLENAFNLEIREGDFHGYGVYHGENIDIFFSDFRFFNEDN